MERLAEISIQGKSYPLNFSVAAAQFAEEKCGGISALMELAEGKPVGFLTAALPLLAVMMDQGAAYLEITAGEAREKLTERQLSILLQVRDFPEVMNAFFQAVNRGIVREVEINPSKKDDPAPEKSPAHGS